MSSVISTIVRPDARPARVDQIQFSNLRDLADRMCELPSQQLANTLAIVDVELEVQPWSATRVGADGGICTLLMLAFPEVHFTFVDRALRIDVPPRLRGAIDEMHFIPWDQITRIGERIRRHRRGYRTLYDPTGVRSWLAARVMSVDGSAATTPYLGHAATRSRRLAVAVDDEADYAFLSGYALYRCGFSSMLVTTAHEFDELERLLRAGDERRVPRLIVSDWDLAFSDHVGAPRGPGLDDLATAGADCPFVVLSSFADGTGHSPPEQFAEGRKGFAVSKATCGCFDLVSAMPPTGRLADNPLHASLARLTSKSTARTRVIGGGNGARHSAPNSARIVADLLLRRARAILRDADDLATAAAMCTAAVLASDAKELGAGGGPATTLLALGLQHRAETRAESAVLGVATARPIDARIESLRLEAAIIGRVRPGSALPAQSLNAIASIVGDLRILFTATEQSEAADACLRHYGQLEAEIEGASRRSRQRHPGRAPWIERVGGVVARPLGRYMDWVTVYGTSMARLIGVSMASMAAFLVLFMCWSAAFSARPWHAIEVFNAALVQSALGFLEVQGRPSEDLGYASGTPAVPRVVYWILVLAEDAVAYLHLGLFLSLAYKRVTRRAT